MNETKKIKLSPRLMACAEYVPQGSTLADIGTDHAYLPVWLIQNGRVSKPVIAGDINEGPLNKARSSAKEYGVESDIVFMLNNGLAGTRESLADTVVIAGMGGETIMDIIRASGWDCQGHTPILQPMSKIYELCRELYENGFYIENERLVRDNGEIYRVLQVKQGEREMPSAIELYAGNSDREDPLYKEYVGGLIKKFSRMERGMAASEKADAALLDQTRSLHKAAIELGKELGL